MLEGLALEQLHGDKRATFELSNVINRADVRMIQQRCGARLAAESLNCLRILGNIVRKKFEGDITAEAYVPGFVDHTHTAATEFFKDAIVGNAATDDGRGVRHRSEEHTSELQ